VTRPREWSFLEDTAPAVAELVRSVIERWGFMLLGTIRQHGTPRISPAETHLVDGHLALALISQSRKAADLRRDDRVTLQSPVTDARDPGIEVKVRGRLLVVDEDDLCSALQMPSSSTASGDRHVPGWSARSCSTTSLFSSDPCSAWPWQYAHWGFSNGVVRLGPASAREEAGVEVEPFEIDVPDVVVSDLRGRIGRARLPSTRTPGPRWSGGTDPEYLAELLDYWADRFDWRVHETQLNSYRHLVAEVNGQRVHFVHLRGTTGGGSGAEPLPVVLSHGWPYSFVEMLPLASRLADPARYGADPDDVFDVVVPSLPGYLYTELPSDTPVHGQTIAALWARLMTDVLGYRRFGTYGEDVGAAVSDWLAAAYSDAVIGIHATHAAYPPQDRRGDLSEAETAFLAWLDKRWEGGTAYSAIQSTRPDTLAAALSDSPAGLAAWLVEKFRAWSDCDGDLDRRFTKDDLLTTITLYWVTNTIGSSFRSYCDGVDEPAIPMISVPAGISISQADLSMPREFCERTYEDIRFWNELPRGGHFTAFEEPDLVAADMREFFRPLRGVSTSAA
jgi:epoxide hydrolase